MKLLLTAFDAFGDDTDNSSREALLALPDQLHGAELTKLVLPTVFGEAAARAIAAAEALRPDAIVCLGQAAGRRAITPERLGVNLMDASVPDNAGFRPCDVPIEPEGPAACFATLPIRAMTAAILAVGVPAEISNTAGLYVCNSLLYAMLRWSARQTPPIPCGFVHLPRPSGELDGDAIVRGLSAALLALTGALSC